VYQQQAEMMSPQYLESMAEDTEVEYITEEEEIVAKEQALLAWMWTFPQISSVVDKETFISDWLSNAVITK